MGFLATYSPHLPVGPRTHLPQIVNDLKRRVSEVCMKSHEMLGVIAELRWEKIDLEVRLLSRLKELQKMWDEMFELQERAASTQSQISSLRE